MRIVVADEWHTSRYPISIDWVTAEKVFVRPEIPNDPRLKLSLIMYFMK